jgi:hypothetical protein
MPFGFHDSRRFLWKQVSGDGGPRDILHLLGNGHIVYWVVRKGIQIPIVESVPLRLTV